MPKISENDLVRSIENNAITEFDEKYWLKKAIFLKNILDQQKNSNQFIGEENSKIFLYELYFTKIHCCETLLRIFIITNKGYFLPLIPLIELSQNKFNSEFIKMQQGIEQYIHNHKKFFYENFYPIDEQKEKVKNSIEFIKKAMDLIITEYSNRQASNVFKHGFYGSLSKDITFRNKDLNKILGKSANMLNWYEIKKDHDKVNLEKKSLSLSLQKEMNIIKICTSILEQMFKVKRAKINKKKSITFSFFLKNDLEKIFSIYNYDDITMSNFTLSIPIELPKKFPFIKE